MERCLEPDGSTQSISVPYIGRMLTPVAEKSLGKPKSGASARPRLRIGVAEPAKVRTVPQAAELLRIQLPRRPNLLAFSCVKLRKVTPRFLRSGRPPSVAFRSGARRSPPCRTCRQGPRRAVRPGFRDVYMTLMYTCELCGANPFDYLTELQRCASEVAANPACWMPWSYRDMLALVPAACRRTAARGSSTLISTSW